MTRKKQNPYIVSAADRAANPGKTSLDIVNERTNARNPNQKPSVKIKSGSSNMTGKSLPTSSNAGVGGNPALVSSHNGTSPIQELNKSTFPEFKPSDANREQAAISGIENQARQRQQDNRSGFQKASDVLSIAINPWSDEKIKATSDNAIINWGLETASNDPFMTAAVVTGFYGLAKYGAAALAKPTVSTTYQTTLKGTPLVSTASRVASNSVTQKLLTGSLGKVGFSAAAIIYLMKEAADSYVFGDFQIIEGMDKLGYAMKAAKDADRPDLVSGINELRDEILNPTGWQKLMNDLPWLTSYRGTMKNLEAANMGAEVLNQIMHA